VPACENKANSQFHGEGRKLDFAHILTVDSLIIVPFSPRREWGHTVDSLGCDKNYWIDVLEKYPFISKKYANYQSP